MRPFSVPALLIFLATSGGAQSAFPQCSFDATGAKVCVGSQPDPNVCATGGIPFTPGYTPPKPCSDVYVQKSSAGQTVFSRILGGVSDDLPVLFFFDAHNNIGVLGTTWSSDFPVTSDAVQPRYGGPPPVVEANGLQGGSSGDLFLTVLSPDGYLLHSTFLGSSGVDSILGMRTASATEVDVLVSAGGPDFPVLPAGSAAPAYGPVLFTLDLNQAALLRSRYLPIAAPGEAAPYTAQMRTDGTVFVTTAAALLTFSREGQLLVKTSLESLGFAELPSVTTDAAGDTWIVGKDATWRPIVAKFRGGTEEVFRWALPIDGPLGQTSVQMQTLRFTPDGLTYIQGFLNAGKLSYTTPNAQLTAPCGAADIPWFVMVLDSQGAVRLVTYQYPPGDPSASVDLTPGVKLACIVDELGVRHAVGQIGAGQIVRLRGGGFGPEAAVDVVPQDRHYPTRLHDLEVEMGGVPAPILAAGPGEVLVVTPFGIPEGGAVPVTIRDHGMESAALPMEVHQEWPILAAVLNADGTPNSPVHPAEAGSSVTLYLSGCGPYAPALDDGELAPLDTVHRIQAPVSVSPGDPSKVYPLAVAYAGPAPGYAGLSQINLQLPATLPPVDFLILSVGDRGFAFNLYVLLP